jgi:hypothetical protein
VPTRRIIRPQRAENAGNFNGSFSTSDSVQSATDIASTSTPHSPAAPAATAPSSSSAESKDENEDGDRDREKGEGDDSATSDIVGNKNSSSSGGTDQEVTASSIKAKGSSAGDADMDVEEDRAEASSVKQETNTALTEHKGGEALSSIPSVAPVPFLSLSSTSVDEQGDKVALKEDEVRDGAMDIDKDVEVKGEVKGDVKMEVKGEGEVKMEVEGEGEVEVKDAVKDEEREKEKEKQKEKEKEPDQTILDQPASGPELKSELTQVASTDISDPDPVTGSGSVLAVTVAVVSGEVTSDATEGAVSSETKATEEGMVVDLLPVKSEIKDEPVASSSSSSASSSASSSSASSSTSAPAPASDSKDNKAVVKDEKKVTPSSSTDTSIKAKDAAAAAAAAVVPPVMPESLPRAPDTFSAIHSLRGYLDVGSASLFAPSEPWVLATASLLMKRKLSKS